MNKIYTLLIIFFVASTLNAQSKAEIFAKENKLDYFADFASNNGAKFYGYQPSEDELLLTRKPVEAELASTLSTRDGDQVVLFGVDEASQWTVSPA